jgi:hypothetical protein
MCAATATSTVRGERHAGGEHHDERRNDDEQATGPCHDGRNTGVVTGLRIRPTGGNARRLLMFAIAAGLLGGCVARRPTHARIEQCIGRADAERRGCVGQCEGDFEDAFVACYGGPDDCTRRCQGQQLACQQGPLSALGLCAGTPEAPGSCAEALRSERAACGARADRVACEGDARRRASTCWQNCQRAQGPALERCAQSFGSCLDACIAPRSGDARAAPTR